MFRSGFLLACWCAAGVCPAISEISANPSSGEPEWIELASMGAELRLASWSLDDGSTKRSLDSTVHLASGARMVLSSDCDKLRAFYGTSSIPCFEPSAWNSLSTISDRVVLRDASGIVCDSVAWNAEAWGAWPQGRSLERLDLSRSGSDPANWVATSGSGGGTPGWTGVPLLEPAGAEISIEMLSRKVVPGRENAIARLRSPWNLVLRAEIFDLTRRRMATIQDGQVPASGELSWNGIAGGRAAPPGAYLLLLEFGTGGKDVQARFREWIVVAK